MASNTIVVAISMASNRLSYCELAAIASNASGLPDQASAIRRRFRGSCGFVYRVLEYVTHMTNLDQSSTLQIILDDFA